VGYFQGIPPLRPPGAVKRGNGGLINQKDRRLAEPEIRNPKSETRNPKPETRNPKQIRVYGNRPMEKGKLQSEPPEATAGSAALGDGSGLAVRTFAAHTFASVAFGCLA